MELIMPDGSHYQVAAGDNLSLIAAGKGRGRTVWNSQGQFQQALPRRPTSPTPSVEPVSRSGAARSTAGKVTPTTTGTGPFDIGGGVLVDTDMDPADVDTLRTIKASAWPGEMWKVINGKMDTVPVLPGTPRPWVAPKTVDNTPVPQFHEPGAQHDQQQGYEFKTWTDADQEQMRKDQIARIMKLAGTD
jgi:hypothetical protein